MTARVMAPLPIILVVASLGSRLTTHVTALGCLQPLGTTLLPARYLPSRASVKLSAESSAAAARRPPPFILATPLTQVVSDIDDTLKSSGGVTLAGVSLGGIDVQYDRGEFYPGVFQFMWEISLFSVVVNQRYCDEYRLERDSKEGGDSSSGGIDPNLGILSPPKVAVLTARAEELKAALEIKDSSKLAQAFRKTGESSKVCPTLDWGIGPVLYGSVSEWIIQHRKGLRKFNNFERLLEQDLSGQIMQVCLLCLTSFSISYAT
jgi:hypothetical protein